MWLLSTGAYVLIYDVNILDTLHINRLQWNMQGKWSIVTIMRYSYLKVNCIKLHYYSYSKMHIMIDNPSIF